MSQSEYKIHENYVYSQIDGDFFILALEGGESVFKVSGKLAQACELLFVKNKNLGEVAIELSCEKAPIQQLLDKLAQLKVLG